MFSLGEAFGMFFGMIGLLFAAVGIGMFVWTVRKAAAYSRTLREGLMAEARCLETFMVHQNSSNGPGHSQRRLILGFYTFDGRDVRAQVTSHQPYVRGDIVPVRYLPHSPERAVPAGAPPPGMGAASCLMGGLQVIFVCMGLLFAVVGFAMALF
ncbi:DUF3592 domain-containing protein [Streptomyces sp. H27-C3]|uniref:DUF3592 domain-containing protein n=1 Tax=Streptomyces sp. H27-C3 TaxID=3046305 RepID=UPI0024BB481A|nr:DUF3592 domain-containing protein [Streptomyces sp. H27-C3]MDJ0466438.1 DUF3592 domain-containing protein [Streptomyces sp. H27-C3]